MSHRLCPDCKIELAPIRILDGLGDQGHGSALQYASPAAKRNIWSGRYPVQGAIGGFLCGECGRVLLYAELPADRLPLPADAGEPIPGRLPGVAGE